MEHPNTPRTPTANAWWALMEDNVEEEANLSEAAEEAKTVKEAANNQWVYPFCSLQLPTNIYVKEKSIPKTELAASVQEKENEANEIFEDVAQSNEKQSIMQRIQAYYDNIQATTFSRIIKIEEEISEQIERVESPCKMMNPETDAFIYEYDEPSIDPIESEGDESTTIQRKESPDIFHELQESIPYLRERSNTFASSKYKNLIGSHATSSDQDSSTKVVSTNGIEQKLMNDSRYYIHDDSSKSPRKFPVSNTFDQCITTGSNDNVDTDPVKEDQFPSPSRTIRTLKTETMTKLSDDSPPKAAVTIPKKDEIPVVPVSMVDTVVSGSDIVKKISSLTMDGDVFHYDDDDDYGHPQTTKMCVPPLLMKKFVSLRNMKLSRSQSSLAQSITTSARRALHNVHSSTEDRDSVPKEIIPIDDLFTESGSKNHAYVAFFRRGLKATQSIRLYQHPIPAVFPIIDGEVVLHVEASTISQTDLQIRRGDFWGEDSSRALNLPIVPGVTFSGIVYQTTPLGLKSGLNVGDRVVSLVQVGANSRHLCLKCEQLVKVPEELNDPCSAACIPEIYLTAFQTLHMGQKNGARYRKTSLAGKDILILGGASLLGRALIEVALAAGCSTVYATGKEKQFQTIYDAGGAPLGRDPRLWRSLLSNKVDLIVGIDHSVGDSEINEDHVTLLSRNGRLILLCNPDRDETTIRIHDELTDFFKINGRKLNLYNVFDAWENELKICKRDLIHLLKLLNDGSIRPQILESIALNKVARAQDLIAGKILNGFIICEPWMKGKNSKGYGVGDVYAESASKSTSYESLTIKTYSEPDDDILTGDEQE